MFTRSSRLVMLVASFSLTSLLPAQDHKASTPAAAISEDSAADRGKLGFKSSCGFCHGEDATGSRAPDLIRSAILNHDEQGNLIGPVIHNGRPEKGMPAFPTLKDNQIADIVAFLHHQADAALHSANVPGDYPLAKMLTGNAEQGKAYFEGPGGCTGCHSITKDLAGISRKYSPVDLQQHMVYPGEHGPPRTAVVTTADGTRFQGKVRDLDEFDIGLACDDGWFRSWPLNKVKIEVTDPLEGHRNLLAKYSDADIHNLFAYLETLK